MVPRKLDVMFGRLPYGGNGGIATETPYVGSWLVETICKMKNDPRIGRVDHIEVVDTPAPMVRNQIVAHAKQWGADVLVMVDSDMYPDWHLHADRQPTDKPFWESSFGFLYKHFDKGPVVVGAPYCGPPPHENVYVFRWATYQSSHPNVDLRLEKFEREEAAILSGIQDVAALPTGLIMYDMRLFDVVDPPYFYYEYEGEGIPCPHCHVRKPGQQARKASTEDVSSTRDMGLAVQTKLGYNPLFCNWDAWAAHCKPKMVHRPKLINMDQVGWKYLDAVKRDKHFDERLVIVGDDNASKPLHQQQVPTQMQEDFFAHTRATDPADIEVLQRLVKMQVANKGSRIDVVEIGTFLGDSAKAMADAGAMVRTVDTWEGSPSDTTHKVHGALGRKAMFEMFRRNVGDRLNKSIVAYVGDSTKVALDWEWKSDLVFIDANHDYEAVLADIKAWWPHLKDGGVMCGHDYNDKFPGVKAAVTEHFGPVDHEHNVWWVVKPKLVNRLAPLPYPEFEEDVPEIIANGHAG